MIDDQIDFRRGVREVWRLKIDNGNSIEFVHALFRDLLDLDLEQFDHRDIFRPCDASKGSQRCAPLVASKDLPQRQPAGDGIGVGIVLQQNKYGLRSLKPRLHLLDLPHGSSQPNMPSEIRLQQFLE